MRVHKNREHLGGNIEPTLYWTSIKMMTCPYILLLAGSSMLHKRGSKAASDMTLPRKEMRVETERRVTPRCVQRSYEGSHANAQR